MMRGNDLYEKHYDKAAAEVQKRYAEAGHKAAAGIKAAVPLKNLPNTAVDVSCRGSPERLCRISAEWGMEAGDGSGRVSVFF